MTYIPPPMPDPGPITTRKPSCVKAFLSGFLHASHDLIPPPLRAWDWREFGYNVAVLFWFTITGMAVMVVIIVIDQILIPAFSR